MGSIFSLPPQPPVVFTISQDVLEVEVAFENYEALYHPRFHGLHDILRVALKGRGRADFTFGTDNEVGKVVLCW